MSNPLLDYRNGKISNPPRLPYSLAPKPVGRPAVRTIGSTYQTFALALKQGQMAKLRQVAQILGIFHGQKPSAQMMIRMIAEGDLLVIPKDRVVNIEDFHVITAAPQLRPEEAEEFDVP